MPISEDEYENCATSEPTSSTMSKAEFRKTHKPIMEKRRRARINHSLNEIKSLILEALKKDPARHSKLEKADILEMAVKHLQNVQRQQLAIAMASDPVVLQKFKAGFNECSDEVNNYINQLDGVDPGMKQRIKNHLQKCINGVEQIAQFNNLAGLNLPFLNATTFFPSTARAEPGLGDQNNNPRIQIPQGLQLIPSRLPSGEFAFLVPNSSNIPLHFSSMANTSSQQSSTSEVGSSQRHSAFVNVIPSALSQVASENLAKAARLLSPPLSPELSNASHSDDSLFANPQLARTPSPHGFRPVNPSIQKSLRSAFMSTAMNRPDILNTSCTQVSLSSNLSNLKDQLVIEDRRSQSILEGKSHLQGGRTQFVQENRPLLLQESRSQQMLDSRLQDTSSKSIREQIEVKSMKFPIHTYVEKERKFMGSPSKKLVEPLCIITNQSERYKQAQTVEDSANCEENLPQGVKRKFSELNEGLLTVAGAFQDASRSKFVKTFKESYPSSIRTVDSAFTSVVQSNIIVRNPLKAPEAISSTSQMQFDEKKEYFDKIFVRNIVDLTESEPEDKIASDEQVSSSMVSSASTSNPNAHEEPEGSSDMWRPW